MSRTAIQHDQGRFLRGKRPGSLAAEEEGLLGTDDEVVASRLGKTRSALRAKRYRMGVLVFRYQRGPQVS